MNAFDMAFVNLLLIMLAGKAKSDKVKESLNLSNTYFASLLKFLEEKNVIELSPDNNLKLTWNGLSYIRPNVSSEKIRNFDKLRVFLNLRNSTRKKSQRRPSVKKLCTDFLLSEPCTNRDLVKKLGEYFTENGYSYQKFTKAHLNGAAYKKAYAYVAVTMANLRKESKESPSFPYVFAKVSSKTYRLFPKEA